MPLAGMDRLQAFIESFVDPNRLQRLSDKGALSLMTEAKRLVPRETGELESAIRVVKPGDENQYVVVNGVGVPYDDPAYVKAHATEYGTWNYSVGTPDAPKVSWPSKSKDDATMPWLSVAARNVREEWGREIGSSFFAVSGLGTASAVAAPIAAADAASMASPPPLLAGADENKKQKPKTGVGPVFDKNGNMVLP